MYLQAAVEIISFLSQVSSNVYAVTTIHDVTQVTTLQRLRRVLACFFPRGVSFQDKEVRMHTFYILSLAFCRQGVIEGSIPVL